MAQLSRSEIRRLVGPIGEARMQDGTFSRPVIFFAREPDGSVAHVQLTTVQEGFRALTRGLEGFCLNHPEWHLAFHALSRAMIDRSSAQVEAARKRSTCSPASPA
jgi:hypothetical protein